MRSTCLTVALAGNPNSGKTTIFNNITGARQHVGNYAGVTVERREGYRRFQGQDLLVIDLPGTYSLTANSLDEVVARNVIIDEKPDLIVIFWMLKSGTKFIFGGPVDGIGTSLGFGAKYDGHG